MIERLLLLRSTGNDIYGNLALEQYLAQNVQKGTCILFLWQNTACVVLGRNQNAWKECRTELLSELGVTLSRRLSGGGAVYQDLGNLNFTLCTREEDSDIVSQHKVILEACRLLGVRAEISGRNDILAEGFKFSGNSFYTHDGVSFHNGTLLLDVDLKRMERCLSPSDLKLSSKAVSSVRSRVVNLCTLKPEIDCTSMCDALEKAFSMVYGLPVGTIAQDTLDREDIEQKRRFFSSYEWVYGRNADFPVSLRRRFGWGEVSVSLEIRNGLCSDVQVYTDALDFRLAGELENALKGKRFNTADLCESITEAQVPHSDDIRTLLLEELL